MFFSLREKWKQSVASTHLAKHEWDEKRSKNILLVLSNGGELQVHSFLPLGMCGASECL